MSQRIRIAVDAMGGDHAPAPIVEGAVEASRAWGHEILLVGYPDRLQKELDRLRVKDLPIRIIPCDSVVTMEDSPAQGCRQKPNSSTMVSARLTAATNTSPVVY